ncbi:ABC transporter ATP-binding protein [Ostreibacterium oceani]|uniref:ATP-binding cassette domain-containing protein n=1 Tax=Ostreibacterium oceani TaxID=2654998 RepID=A0A6N7EV95_9GAMM|nr:ABC transporter ATP-binding protein [Ostreibacterium oceani]MPV86382.1 ATP-binding cassette domain-containing protein [Ostreibacterium oceani]
MSSLYLDHNIRPASVELRNVSWGQGILQSVSLTLEPGKTLAVLGANGAGKSSLLRLIYGYYTPERGQILIDDQSLQVYSKTELSRRLAVVLQEQAGDFALTVKDMISLGRMPYLGRFSGLREQDHAMIDHALQLFDLVSFAKRSFTSLSGGEKQRVMFARAFCQAPSLIILDEPTNHLDIRHQLELISLIKQLGITVIASLHDLNQVADFADDILLLSRGKMIAQGKVETVLNPAHIQQAFDVLAIPRGISRFDFALPSF